ncbi:MAG: hypothetical protein IT317_02575 [Anaerolineales bacterium]|nr:hypothetical protein [Anaerolineales bacterium]
MPTPPTAPPGSAPNRLRAVSLAGLTAAALLLALWLLLGASQPPAWAGGNYAILQTYPNPSPAPVTDGGEEFGYSLAYLPNSNQLIVGSWSDQVTTTIPGGLVYLLNATTGAVNHILSRTVPAASDQFGASVSGVLTAVVVGAPKVDVSGPSNTNDGAVFLYDATTGALIHFYPHPSAAANDEFGTAVAIISDTIVVGVPKYNGSHTDVGRVYLCRMEEGDCPTVVDNPSTGAAGDGDKFGLTVVALPGGFAVGAPVDGSHGTVYVYSFDGAAATLTTVISTTLTASGDQFGRSLAVVGDKLLIGAPYDGLDNTGAAYLYDLNGTQLHKFTDPDPHPNDRFGTAVGGDGNLMVVGSAEDDAGANDSGLISIFDNDSGTDYPFVQSVGPSAPSSGLNFGFALTPLNGDFAVSALKADQGATDAGAVYRVGYQAVPPTATATATATAPPNGIFIPAAHRP